LYTLLGCVDRDYVCLLICFLVGRPRPPSTPFPYTTLFRSMLTTTSTASPPRPARGPLDQSPIAIAAMPVSRAMKRPGSGAEASAPKPIAVSASTLRRADGRSIRVMRSILPGTVGSPPPSIGCSRHLVGMTVGIDKSPRMADAEAEPRPYRGFHDPRNSGAHAFDAAQILVPSCAVARAVDCRRSSCCPRSRDVSGA